MNNIFALSQFSDLKDKLIAAGKSGGTDAIQKMIDDTDGLKDAMNNAGLTADDLKDSIMSIADPDAKNLEGIKENLEDIFGKDGLGQSDFFKGKTDEEIENFWDYLQDNNYNPKQMKWNEKTTKKNFEAAQEAKKKTPEESATFVSKFKNAAEDTATDIDTVTDNFQSDMKNIQSAMESVTNGTFQNSDMADLIQQFPELSNASGDLKDNLQNLAMNKGAEAIGKIRDAVKDVTDPKQLAQADKYVQSIMDAMDMSDFDFSEKAVRARAFGALTKDSKNAIDIKNKGDLVDSLMEKYSGNETAMQAIVQLSMDPSMADATMEEWETKIEDQEVQIKINADTKELDNLSKSMTRLQTDASNTQTDMSNKAAFNQKVNKNDYDALIKNGNAQIKNYDEQIAHYKNLQKTLKENNIDAESTEQWKQWQDNIDAAQQSIENMKASQAEWGDAIKNLPITDITNLSSAITTAMSEMQSDTGLTTDSVKNLAAQFSDLGDINIDSLYTRTAKGLQLNTDRLQDYMEQQNDFVNSDFENKVKDQKKIVEDTFKAYQNGDKSLADYTAEQDALDELLNRRNQYFARYQDAQEQFTDFQKMINAENAANAGDEYTTAKSKLDELKELYDNNLIGTEKFKKGAAYFSQNGFEDPENFIENYNHLKDYYTDDSSGPQKFLEDLNKKGLATYETLANGQKQWAYSFNDVKDAADQMGMSYESFQSILGRLSDYGFVNNLVTSTQDGEQQIDELTDDLITEKNKLSKLKANGATDQAIQDQENVVDQLESKISGVNQAVTDYANGETDRKVQDLKEAKQIIKDSKEAYDEAMKSGDTDLAQKLRKNIQDTAKDNDIELTPELNIDEKALDKQIDNLQSEAREKSVQKYKDIQDQLYNGQTEWTDSEDFNAADTITKLEQAQSENAEGFNNLVSNMKKYNLSDLESMIFGNGAYESENQGLRDMEDQIQGFAESIGLTADQTNMLVPILEAMGTLDISPKVDNSELEKTVTDAQTAEQTLEETTGKQYNFNFNTTDLDTIQKQVDQVKKDIEDTYLKRDENGNVIRDENGIPTYDYSAPGAKETAQIYDASIKQQQQAEYQTSALGQSTSSDEVVKAAQDYMTAKNAMDVETQKYNLGMENNLQAATENANNAMEAYAKVADKNGNPLETDLKNLDPQKLEDQLLGVTDKDLKVKVGADTSDAENDIQNLQNLEGSSITINADVSTNGGVEELQDSLASIPQGVSTTVTCDVEGESDVDNLESSMESIPDNTPVTIDCHVENQEQLDQINQKADELNANGKQIKINATVGEVKTDGATSNTPIDVKGNVTKITGNPSGTVDVKGNVTSVTGNPSGTVNVKGNITGITNEDAVKGKADYTVGHSPKKVPDASGKANFGLGKHPEKAPDIWGTAHYTGDFPTSAPTLSGTVVYHAQIQGAPSGAQPVATGTMLSPAHASGTAYNVLNMKQLSPAHAGGNVALKHNEQALVNEVGTESIVRNGVWSLLPGGAHLENLKQGDIVFSASQTKDLLEHGRTAGHARAYAEGTASLAHAYARSSAANGGGAFGGVATRTTPSNTSSNNNANNAQNNNAIQAIADNTDSIAKSSGETADNTSKWEDPWKNAVDWFERYSTKIDNKLDLNSAISENYQGNKNSKNPFSIETKNRKLSDSISTIQQEVPNYQKQRDYYAWQAEAYGDKIGLSQDLRKLVQEGKIQDIEIYDEDTKSKIEAYQTWYDKVHSVESSIEDLKSKEADLWNQKFSNITDRYDALKSIYSNNNDVISARMDYREASGQSQTSRSAYANDIKLQRTNQIKQNSLTAVEIKKYQTELRNLGKEYGTQSTIYKQAQANLIDLNKEYQEGKKSVQEFTNKLNEIKLTDLQNVIDKYDRASSKQSSYRDWKDATHYKGTSGVTQNDIKEGIKTNEKSINALYAKRAEVQRQMLNLSPGSEDYQSKAKEFAQLSQDILNTVKNTAELRQELAKLRTDQYDKAIKKLDHIVTDCENIQGMMDSDTFLSDDGSFTTNGLTNIALENQSIQANQRKIADWKQELAELQKAYNNHYITEEDFISQSESIVSNINQAAKDINSSQQNLISTYIDQITKENEYLQDNISKRKEALDAKKDYYDFDKTIKSKTKDINAIKAQIAALEGTTNAVAKAKLEQLKADLADKQDDLNDTKYDHKIDMESKGYDNLADQADKALDSATQAIKTNTDMQKSVISNMLKEVQKNYKDVYSNITDIVKDSGAQISTEFNKLLTNIKNGKGNFTVTITSKAKANIGGTNAFDNKAPGSTGRENGKTNTEIKNTAKDMGTSNGASDENGTGKQMLQKVTASPSSITMGVGRGASVKIGFVPSNATYKTFTYEESNKGIVSIVKGKASLSLKGLKVGSTTITVKGHGAGCKSAKITVKVTKDGAQKTAIAKNVAKSMGYSLHTNDVTKILNATKGESNSSTKDFVKSYILQKKRDAAEQKITEQEIKESDLKTKLFKWFTALPAFKGDASKIADPVIKHIAQKGKKATIANIQTAASILGYKDYKNVSKWSSAQKNALVKKLQSYGFANGGIIRNLIPASMGTLLGNAIMRNGDTGLISARQGETVLTEEFTNMLKPTVAAMNAFTDMYQKMSTPNINSTATKQQTIFNPEYNINITGMDLSKANELKSVIRGELDNHDKQLAKEFKKFR
nr:MAG TPA: chromosome segregation ATPase [Bacteriophage sp.]